MTSMSVLLPQPQQALPAPPTMDAAEEAEAGEEEERPASGSGEVAANA
jgi:hypothetical protein